MARSRKSRKRERKEKHTSGSIGWCEVHGKSIFGTQFTANNARRRLLDGTVMSVYQCTEYRGFHIGHPTTKHHEIWDLRGYAGPG